jgi:hypothetical protein
MKNLDIIILTAIVVFCFITFFISTFRAFEKLEKENNYISKERGIISTFLAYLESLVTER